MAWAFYVSWIVVEVPGSFSSRVLAALILCVFGGFSAALVLMGLPWTLAVWVYRNVRWSGAAYFTCVGALLMFLVGCAASSLSPKPLFIEDQTFFEGALIAVERQGICLTLAGMIVGLGYWFLAERHVTGEHHPHRACD